MITTRARKRWSGGVVAATVALAMPVLVAVAPTTDDAGTESDGPVSIPDGAHGAPDAPALADEYPRLAPDLAELLDGTAPASAPLSVGSATQYDATTGTVPVVIWATDGHAHALQEDLASGTSTDVAVVGENVLATVPLTTLAALNEDPRVIMAYVPPQPMVDAIEGEGPGVMNTDHWVANGATGKGVRVAVIDLGFAGYSNLLGTELPASVTVKDYCNSPLGGSQKHGTGVAEIVHETAPDAQLFLICVDDPYDLAQAVAYSIDNNIDIISHSVSWWGPQFLGDGTGLVGDIVDDAIDADILWVNSAGNYAQQHWGGYFNDTDGNDFHNFGPGDDVIAVNLAAGQTVKGILRWYDGTASDNDYELLVYLPSAIEPFAWSDNPQAGITGHYGYETVDVINTGSGTATVYFVIWNRDGLADNDMHMDLFLVGAAPIEHAVAEGSLFDPAVHPDVLTVGAHEWSHPDTIEPFSSQGPTKDGRTKPDVIGPDGVSNASYQTGFFGTSAATPYVAGAAAVLLSSSYARGMEPGELIDYIIDENVVTTGLTGPFPSNQVGNGRVKLWNAPTAPFPDVGLSNPFMEDVAWLADSGVSGGYTDGTFRPTANVSRMAMAAFLYRYEGEPGVTPGHPTFSDVAESHPFYTEISWLGGSGITSGYSDGTFRPSANVSRMAMAAFLYRQQGEPAFTAPATPTFPDVATTHAFYDEIEWLASTGITGGYSDGRFRPSNNVTRQAMAAFLHRLDSL